MGVRSPKLSESMRHMLKNRDGNAVRLIRSFHTRVRPVARRFPFASREFSAYHRAMPTVLRVGPYRFFFYAGDRAELPHVHIELDDANAKFWLHPVRAPRS